MTTDQLGRAEHISRINTHFKLVEGQLLRLNPNGFHNLNIVLEHSYCGMLNMVFGLNLTNKNDVQLNTPAIDLADDHTRVSIQLSSSTTLRKIRQTLRAFFRHNLHTQYQELYIVFIGNYSPTVTDYSAELKYGFPFNYEDHVWDHAKLFSKICTLETSTIKAIADYLDIELGKLPGNTRCPSDCLPPLIPISNFFIPQSRDEKIRELSASLQEKTTLFLWGPGGIGTTQCALSLAKSHSPEYGTYYIKYLPSAYPGEDAMQTTILEAKFNHARCTCDDPTQRKQEFNTRIRILRQYGPKIILIVDDFWLPGCELADLQHETSYMELENTGVQLICTTRFQLNNWKKWQITALDEDQLIAQILNQCNDDTMSADCLRPLVRAVGSNTMMAYLIALTLAPGTITPEELLNILENGLPEGMELPMIRDERTMEKGTLFDHMYQLHDIAKLDENTRQVLALTLLAGPEEFDLRLFNDCLSFAQKSALQNLYATSWVIRQNRKISTDPVIRLSCRGRLAPDVCTLRSFLQNMRAKWEHPQTTQAQQDQIRRYFDAASVWFGGDPQMLAWHSEITPNATEGGQ